MKLALKPAINFQAGQAEIINKKELESLLESLAEKYQNMIVTNDDESLKEAKAIRADLNKVKTALNASRLEVRREFMKPIDQLKIEVDELIMIVDDVWADLDKDIKEIEELQREERRENVNELIEKYGKGYDITFKDNWLNKTAQEHHIIDDIKAQAREIEQLEQRKKQEIETIKEMAKLNDLDDRKYVFMIEQGVDLTKAIAEFNRDLEKEKKAENEESKQEEVKEVEEKQEANTIEAIMSQNNNITNILEVTGTVEQLQGLADYCKDNGITVKVVK